MGRKTIKRKARGRAAPLEEAHLTLVQLYDDMAETNAWAAFLYDGICGITGDSASTVDPATQEGMRFAAIWLKRRSRDHASRLKAVCDCMRDLRK